jgi:hypothetical protein
MTKKARAAQNEFPDPPVLTLSWDVLDNIIRTIGAMPAETGGPFGGQDGAPIVDHFHFDESSRNSAVTYTPDYRELNRLFKTAWNPKGVRLRGFAHSHPGRGNRPSVGDEVYAERILKAIEDMDCLWLPIVNTIPDTRQFRLTPWVAYLRPQGVEVVRGNVVVASGNGFRELPVAGGDVMHSVQCDVPLDEIIIGNAPTQDRQAEPLLVGDPGRAMPKPADMTFDRVRGAYDLNIMYGSTVIAIGAGGAASWLEDVARAGIGRIIMMDHDVVSETNLATQQTYRRDIGRPKVECIAERIRDINRGVTVVAIQKSFDDLSDDAMRDLVVDTADLQRVVLCGLTDQFLAQARVNRLALTLGIPSLNAQVYKEGRGAEITFTYPGVTPACHRCILSSRYRYYLEQHRANDVTSHGTPIFATGRLNALKGFILMAILHHGTDHPRWGRMLKRIGNRNLVQVRLDPDIASSVGLGIFDKALAAADRQRLFFDETLWLPQQQECPETGYATCPDCGGTGDLRDAIGRFADTRSIAEAASATIAPTGDANVQRAVAAYKQNRSKP